MVGARDYALLVFLMDSGLRVSELCQLQLSQLDWVQGCVRVLGKGNKERIVPFGAVVKKALWRWVNEFRPENLHQELFVTTDGRPMKRQGIALIILRRARSAGIEGVRCSPHTFRHTFAITYLRNGGDVFSLQRILGHTTLDMVRQYVNLASGDVLRQHHIFSPADNLAKTEGLSSVGSTARRPRPPSARTQPVPRTERAGT